MSRASTFPWHYFIRAVRARILLVILTSLATFVVCNLYSEFQFPKILLIIIGFSFLSIIQGYLRVRPFRDILNKIDEIQIQLPHNKKLNIIYQKNEWVLIQEMLKLTEKYIREQSQQILIQEQQSLTLTKSIPDPLIIVDSLLNCKQYNDQFKNSFIKGKETKIYTDEKLWKIFEDETILNLFQKSQQSNTLIKLAAHKIANEYYDISITPFADTKGQGSGSLGLFHNVTRPILTEKMRVDFVANVSHEIRTPLTSIKGFSQLLLAQKDLCPPSLHNPLDRIVHNTERLKDMFDSLLQLSVIEGQYTIKKQAIDLTKLILAIKQNLKQKHPNVSLIINIKDDQQIYGDRKLLEQVFTNLIDNSIKYNPLEETLININSLAHDQTSFISIQDNGVGILDTDLERIFERFYRVHGTRTQNIEGTGLGLSIVKHIINKHNGHVSVESKINEGTIFKIELPLN
jgi:two-component system phosphate regulon sensor histidine kinase PhoR